MRESVSDVGESFLAMAFWIAPSRLSAAWSRPTVSMRQRSTSTSRRVSARISG